MALGEAVQRQNLEVAPAKAKSARDNLVDYARLGLATSVWLYHMNQAYTGKANIRLGLPLYHSWPTEYGIAWAVPAFLAISGFYVLRSYEQSSSWLEFIKKRVLRIVPAFLLSLILIGYKGGLTTVWNVLVYYATVGEVRLGPFVNGPVWSLGAEEIAYAVLAILFTLGAYRKRWPIWVAFVISCLFVEILSKITTNNANLELFPIVPSFFSGSLVYIYRDHIRGLDWWGFALIGVALLLPALVLNPSPVGFMSYAPGVLMGVGILAVRGFKMPRIPDFSYGLYIYHYIVMYLVFPQPPIYNVLWLAVLLPISWYLVEKPALSLKNRKSKATATAGVTTPQPAET
jgi:peptidoglycan/LPS O-acetylase OafA/YrhL